MTTTSILKLIDGALIAVPNSLDLITPYVLLEQEDWFEDEIKFLRKIIQPGSRVIDVGANYGIYTLSLAKKIGASGVIWSFEPASGTAKYLSESIAANNFSNIILDQSALSDEIGTADLYLDIDSELNSLSKFNTHSRSSEKVKLTTLDDCTKKYQWKDISFVKIDAEGEEENIIKGGINFFNEFSPLVQFEVKAQENQNTKLIDDFLKIGYDCFRLVPGLGVLVPFDSTQTLDDFALNLFCCKKDRAKLLASQGLLVESLQNSSSSFSAFEDYISPQEIQQYSWPNTVGKLSYGLLLFPSWKKTMAQKNDHVVEFALINYAISQDENVASDRRFDALKNSFDALNQLCSQSPTYLRLSSLARVARDYGERRVAVMALQELSQKILSGQSIDLGEPFLAPGVRFDSMPAEKSLINWTLAAVLEEYERLGSFSSFYTEKSALERLKIIDGLGVDCPEMKRRLKLIEGRFKRPLPKYQFNLK